MKAEIHGTVYYNSPRYGYGAIDCTHKNTSGCETIESGITPQKLASRMADKLNEAQRNAYYRALEALLVGESANSQELYLYATNDKRIYEKLTRPFLVELKKELDEFDGDFSRMTDYGIHSLTYSAYNIFETAAEHYEKEFPRGGGNEWYQFTPLDFFVCAERLVNHYLTEYKCNKLEGY